MNIAEHAARLLCIVGLVDRVEKINDDTKLASKDRALLYRALREFDERRPIDFDFLAAMNDTAFEACFWNMVRDRNSRVDYLQH
jgi:hypothetical protein